MTHSICRPWRFAPLALVLGSAGLGAAETLDLETAMRLALDHQPRVEAWRAEAQAERAAATAEAQLPDPRLMTGIRDFPVDGPMAGGFDDDMTMVEIGITQEFPLASKRQLMSERRGRQAESAAAMAEQARREVRRDAGLAWLEVYLADRSAELIDAQRAEADRFAQATEIAYRAGRAPQLEVLGARIEAELLTDRADEQRQRAREARAALARWIGDRAEAALAELPPAVLTQPQLEAVLRHVEAHPHLAALQHQRHAAQSEVALAEKAYRPDWSMDAYYAQRPDFPDYAGLRVTVDLPLFTGRRQDRRLEESRARLDKAGADLEDARREQLAEARATLAGWQEVQRRLGRFEDRILPQARSAVAAAQAAYGAGASSLAELLRARQAVLDAELQHLALRVEAQRLRLRLHYFFE